MKKGIHFFMMTNITPLKFPSQKGNENQSGQSTHVLPEYAKKAIRFNLNLSGCIRPKKRAETLKFWDTELSRLIRAGDTYTDALDTVLMNVRKERSNLRLAWATLIGLGLALAAFV